MTNPTPASIPPRALGTPIPAAERANAAISEYERSAADLISREQRWCDPDSSVEGRDWLRDQRAAAIHVSKVMGHPAPDARVLDVDTRLESHRADQEPAGAGDLEQRWLHLDDDAVSGAAVSREFARQAAPGLVDAYDAAVANGDQTALAAARTVLTTWSDLAHDEFLLSPSGDPPGLDQPPEIISADNWITLNAVGDGLRTLGRHYLTELAPDLLLAHDSAETPAEKAQALEALTRWADREHSAHAGSDGEPPWDTEAPGLARAPDFWQLSKPGHQVLEESRSAASPSGPSSSELAPPYVAQHQSDLGY